MPEREFRVFFAKTIYCLAFRAVINCLKLFFQRFMKTAFDRSPAEGCRTAILTMSAGQAIRRVRSINVTLLILLAADVMKLFFSRTNILVLLGVIMKIFFVERSRLLAVSLFENLFLTGDDDSDR